VLIYPPGALLLTSAHLANALPDIETDSALGQRGLATFLGPRRAFLLMLALFAPPALTILSLSIARHDVAATTLSAAGICFATAAGLIGSRHVERRAARKLVFWLMAPAVALLGVGTLLTISAVQ
jgi:1,4-dihydroxy-2-naphthoate octaprenyltransferase